MFLRTILFYTIPIIFTLSTDKCTGLIFCIRGRIKDEGKKLLLPSKSKKLNLLFPISLTVKEGVQ